MPDAPKFPTREDFDPEMIKRLVEGAQRFIQTADDDDDNVTIEEVRKRNIPPEGEVPPPEPVDPDADDDNS